MSLAGDVSRRLGELLELPRLRIAKAVELNPHNVLNVSRETLARIYGYLAPQYLYRPPFEPPACIEIRH